MSTEENIVSDDFSTPLYFFYQETEKTSWLPAPAFERDNIIKTKKPALVSALDVDNSFEVDLTVEEIRNLRYSGPLYFDWDSLNIAEATKYFQQFLVNLKAKEVSLDMLRLYATGKKGYHCEIPMQVFMGKVPGAGILNLPDMYREMAHALYVETLDMRIYTARRGRMWRSPNVLRDNGAYKVQITVDEALNMAPELYKQLCSSPRPPLPTEPPVLNGNLGLIYAQARDKVEVKVAGSSTKVRTASATAKAFKARFKSALPPTLAALGRGRFRPRRGWNEVVMQFCLAAIAVDMSADETVAACKQMIQSHESDGNRYSSPAKREDHLRTMYSYLDGASGYTVSVAGIRSILPQGLPCDELKGL